MNHNLLLFLLKVGVLIGTYVLKNLHFINNDKFFKDWAPTFINTLSFLLVSSLVLQLFLQAYRRRRKIGQNKGDNFIAGFNNLFNVLIIVSFLYMGLKLMGISVGEFFTSISIVAAAIVVLTKEYLSALISGFVISFSNIINIGDLIKVNTLKGRIQDITLSKTIIATEDDELIIMPNDKIFFAEITNYSKGNRRRVSIPFELELRLLETVNRLEAELIDELDEFKEYIEQRSFTLRVEEIHKDFVSFKFLYTLLRLDPKIEAAIRRKTVRKVVDYINTMSKSTKL